MSTAWLPVFCKVSVESVGETLALRMRTGEAAVAVPATVAPVVLAPAVVAVAELADELVAVDCVLESDELEEGVPESDELDEGVPESDDVDDEGVLDSDEPVEADGVPERVEPVETDGVLDGDALPDGVLATAPVELVTPAVVVPLADELVVELPETGVVTALDPVVDEVTPLVGVALGADEQATSAVRAAAPAMLRSHVRFDRTDLLLRGSSVVPGRMRAILRGRSPERVIAWVGATGE